MRIRSSVVAMDAEDLARELAVGVATIRRAELVERAKRR